LELVGVMRIYLAGSGWSGRIWIDRGQYDFFRLESYHNISKAEVKVLQNYKGFLLDSGAFTFMSGGVDAKNIDWDKYVYEYASFIESNKTANYFELDIDSIVGINEVERLRKALEKKSGYRSIPVWHKSRGLDYWKKMCKDYDYIAIGGIVTQEIKRSEYDVFIPLLKIARQHSCKVHGLGFTNLKGLQKYPFYSVDSTSWLSGSRYGGLYMFNGKSLDKVKKPEGKRMSTVKTAEHNFDEWIKFQKYAENNL